MKRILVGGFHQESNSFNPVLTTREAFAKSMQNGSALFALRGSSIALGGILDELAQAGIEPIPSCFAFSQSGGPLEQDAVVLVLDQLLADIRAAQPLDGIILMLHGATQSAQWEDCCGEFLAQVRKVAGPDVTIAASLDLHANITARMLASADALCGYRKYPHIDMAETGRRTVRLALRHIEKPLRRRAIRVPMIFPASAYTTEDGPVHALMTHAEQRAKALSLTEYSIFQMQPWLDVKDAGSCILAYGDASEALEQFVTELSREQLNLAGKIQPSDCTLEQVVRHAEQNNTGKPDILCDAADSANAGATGDNAAVLAYVVQHSPNLRFAFALEDAPAARRAAALGPGTEGEFILGGAKNPSSVQIALKARVRTVSEGLFRYCARQFRGMECSLGLTAVLESGNVTILVCESLCGSSDPQMYRAFGIEPLEYQLVDVKACTSFREPYQEIANRIFCPPTPGAASADLLSLPFHRLVRPFYPFDPIEAAADHCTAL